MPARAGPHPERYRVKIIWVPLSPFARCKVKKRPICSACHWVIRSSEQGRESPLCPSTAVAGWRTEGAGRVQDGGGPGSTSSPTASSTGTPNSGTSGRAARGAGGRRNRPIRRDRSRPAGPRSPRQPATCPAAALGPESRRGRTDGRTDPEASASGAPRRPPGSVSSRDPPPRAPASTPAGALDEPGRATAHGPRATDRPTDRAPGAGDGRGPGAGRGRGRYLRTEVRALDAQLEAGGALELGLAAAAVRLAHPRLHGRHAAWLGGASAEPAGGECRGGLGRRGGASPRRAGRIERGGA